MTDAERRDADEAHLAVLERDMSAVHPGYVVPTDSRGRTRWERFCADNDCPLMLTDEEERET